MMKIIYINYKDFPFPKNCTECKVRKSMECMISGRSIMEFWHTYQKPSDCPLKEMEWDEDDGK